ncbi:MAG: peptidoglycan editing factor PgeF [Mariprofundaceae bacterium]|nr:peptidoglycan editing factor PgeF [Mariprofundaceae bacterium]
MAELPLLRSALLEAHGITAFFTTRQGGVSPSPFDSLNFGGGLGDDDNNIQANIAQLLAATGLKSAPHQARQEHGIAPLFCSGPGRLHEQAADMLLTRQAGCAVAVRIADCVPILLADPETGLAAAVHAGWRGTARGIIRQAVTHMQSHEARTGDILACIGPCIGPCCFNVGEETAAALLSSCDDASRYIQAKHTDLAGINMLQLQQAGVDQSHIEQVGGCTACDSSRFFSHRRDHGRTGRHLAVVALPEAA